MGIIKRTRKNKDKVKNGKITKGKTVTTYEVNFTWRDIYGDQQRYQKSGFKTKAEAKEHYSTKYNELVIEGRTNQLHNATLKEVFDEFLEDGVNDYQENTINDTKKYYKDMGVLANKKIKDIDYRMLQMFFNKYGETHGLETSKSFKKALNRVFKYAENCGFISKNPLTNVSISGINNHMDHSNYLEYDDYLKIINTLNKGEFKNDRAYCIAIEIAYYCGLRISEVLALDKSDFDLDNQILSVNKKLVWHGLRKHEYHVVSQMKSKASQDNVFIHDDIVKDIEVWFEMNPYDVAVCDSNGKYISPDSLSARVKSVAEPYGIDFHFHMLRHSLATNMALCGINPLVTQSQMRHKDISTTQNIYTHLPQETQKKAFNSFKPQ